MAKKKSATSGGLRKCFTQNKGKVWIDCNTGKPFGLSGKKDKNRPYPACRPTRAQCNSAAKRKTGPARISWKKKTRKKK